MLVKSQVQTHHLLHPSKNRHYVFTVWQDEDRVDVVKHDNHLIGRRQVMTSARARKLYAFLVRTHHYESW